MFFGANAQFKPWCVCVHTLLLLDQLFPSPVVPLFPIVCFLSHIWFHVIISFRFFPERASAFLKKLTDTKFDAVVGQKSTQWKAKIDSHFPVAWVKTEHVLSVVQLVWFRAELRQMLPGHHLQAHLRVYLTPAAGTYLHNMECQQSRDAALQV